MYKSFSQNIFRRDAQLFENYFRYLIYYNIILISNQ